MIRKLHRITSFGVFEDFTWPGTLNNFKQFNLLFGWNYSGKTTFSRTFRCFELAKRHADFASAEVHLHCDDSTVHTLSTTAGPHHFRVFNVDFVRDNLFFDEGAAEPILILGASDIAKQQALQEKQIQLTALVDEIQAASSERRNTDSALERALTAAARDNIKKPLNRLNYDKTKFQRQVTECKANPASHILGDADYNRELNTFNSTDKKPHISAVPRVSLSPLLELSAQVEAVVSRSVKAVTIQAFEANPELEQWVNKGRHLHEGQSKCLFCGSTLPVSLMGMLADHFSDEYEVLMANLTDIENSIIRAANESAPLPQLGSFYTDLAENLKNLNDIAEPLMSDRRASLAVLTETIHTKRLKAFTPVSAPSIVDNGAAISLILDEISALTETHNERSRQFDQNREDAFLKLEQHWASQFAIDQDYAATTARVAALKVQEEQKTAAKLTVAAEISQLEREISEAVKGAETINDLLKAYFGKGDLRVSVAEDNRLRITRNGSVAKNLSEGERSAIAFVHFMTQLQDERHPLSQTTVVVDDPMCSLDANHLFNTYSFLKTKLSTCYQLFILTHNYEFYSLIKEWALDKEGERAKKPQADWKHWSIYLIRRKDDGTATVETIPPELLKFKSEYHYLFATLLRFQTNAGSDYDYLFSLPNVARRFLEAFGGIMIPTHAGLRSKLPRLIADEIQRERVWRFITDYSHNNSLNRSLFIPDVSECKGIVDACLNAVKQWDSDYFDDLASAVQ
jgi:wobble nucleotide-excising tRNase